MNRCELLQRLHSSEPEHRPLASSEAQVAVLTLLAQRPTSCRPPRGRTDRRASGNLAKLQHTDGLCRRAATAELARYPAERLECLDIAFHEWRPVPGKPSLFAERCTARLSQRALRMGPGRVDRARSDRLRLV